MALALWALQMGQDQALHTLATGNCEPIPALALALSRKAGQPLKSLQGHPGSQEVEGHQPGTLPTGKRSEENSLWSFTLELHIKGYLLLEIDDQVSCWLRSARAGRKARRAVKLKYPDKISCLALHHAYACQLSSCFCPSWCPSEGIRSLLPTPHLSQHWPWHRKNSKPKGCSAGAVQIPFFCLPGRW